MYPRIHSFSNACNSRRHRPVCPRVDVTRIIDTDRHFMHVTVTGEITLAEIRADMARLAAEPHYSPDMTGIVDMRNAVVNLTESDLQQLTGEIKNNPRIVARARRALLVGSDSAFDFYSRFASMAGGGRVEYGVFREEAAARDWLEEAIFRRRLGHV
jgi:hypothetical protein